MRGARTAAETLAVSGGAVACSFAFRLLQDRLDRLLEVGVHQRLATRLVAALECIDELTVIAQANFATEEIDDVDHRRREDHVDDLVDAHDDRILRDLRNAIVEEM